MFSAEKILERFRERPFRPLQFVLTTGQTYDVYHPDLVFILSDSIIIGLPSKQNETIADFVTRVSLFHITELKDLPVVMNPQSNGTA